MSERAAPARDAAPAEGPGPSGRSLVRWWTGLGRGPQVAVALLATAVAVNLALAGARSLLGGDPGGPVSSSFSTGGDGLEAYADLLTGDGHRSTRLRGSLQPGDLAPSSTAIVADPTEVSAGDLAALRTFVAGGGRLVLAGESSADLVGSIAGSPVGWRSVGPADRLRVWLPVDATGPARQLAGDEGGRWTDVAGPLVPVAGVDGRPAVLVARVGRGRIVALADAAPLQNAHLGSADNAAFALALAGPTERPVVFVESLRGYSSSGLAAVPPAWKWTAAGLGVALVAGLWAAASRFGPPEPTVRQLRPPRRAHVDAVAAGLDRVAPDPMSASAPLQVRGRRELAHHLGVDDDASPAVLHAAAEAAGVAPAEVAILVQPPAGLEQALAVGAATARRQRVTRRAQLPPERRPDAEPRVTSQESAR